MLHTIKTAKNPSKSCVDHLILICVTPLTNKMIMITNHTSIKIELKHGDDNVIIICLITRADNRTQWTLNGKFSHPTQYVCC